MSKFTKNQLLNQIRDGVLSGSMSRSSSIKDPRARRGAQTESLPSQRFDPEFFEVRSDGVLTVNFENIQRQLDLLEDAGDTTATPTAIFDYIGEDPFDTTSNISLAADNTTDWYEEDPPSGSNLIVPTEGVVQVYNDTSSDFTTSSWVSAGDFALAAGTYHWTSGIQLNNTSTTTGSWAKGAYTDDVTGVSTTVYRFLHANGANDLNFDILPEQSCTMYSEFVLVLGAAVTFQLRMAAQGATLDIERASLVIRKMA